MSIYIFDAQGRRFDQIQTPLRSETKEQLVSIMVSTDGDNVSNVFAHQYFDCFANTLDVEDERGAHLAICQLNGICRKVGAISIEENVQRVLPSKQDVSNILCNGYRWLEC